MVFGSHFIFDGINSKDYNLLLCSIDDNGDSEMNMGLDYEVISYESIYQRFDYGAKYSDVLQFEFSVIHEDGESFSRQELRDIMAWLDNCKEELKWLTFYDEDVDRNINYLCRITSKKKIKIGGNIIGFRFEVTCDSPYAYSDLITKTSECKNMELQTINFYMDTDEIIFPYMKLTAKGTWKLFLKNTTAETNDPNQTSTFEIQPKELPANEILTIDHCNYIITSTKRTSFESECNYNWFYFIRGENIVELKFNGTITFSYRCKYKVGEF